MPYSEEAKYIHKRYQNPELFDETTYSVVPISHTKSKLKDKYPDALALVGKKKEEFVKRRTKTGKRPLVIQKIMIPKESLRKPKTELIKGGLASNLPDFMFDPKQLKVGIKVEMEHTNDPKIAKEIAKDHLVELSNYYTYLEKMEIQAKKSEFINALSYKTIPEIKRLFKHLGIKGYSGKKKSQLKEIYNKYANNEFKKFKRKVSTMTNVEAEAILNKSGIITTSMPRENIKKLLIEIKKLQLVHGR